MNDFTDLMFIFIYVFVLMYFHIIDVRNGNIIMQKLIIAVSVFGFVLLLELIKSVNMKHPRNIKTLVVRCMLAGFFAYVGHTMLIDLMHIDDTRPYIDMLNDTFSPEIVVGIFVVAGITCERIANCMFRVSRSD